MRREARLTLDERIGLEGVYPELAKGTTSRTNGLMLSVRGEGPQGVSNHTDNRIT